MITFLRRIANSWVFQGLLLLIAGSFCFFGVNKFTGQAAGLGGDTVVSAGDRSVSAQDFKREFESAKRNYSEQNPGQSFTPDEFVAAGQHLALIDELADRAGMSAWLDTMGIKPSANLIAKMLAKMPAFQNQVTGKFDRKTYEEALARNNLTIPAFQKDAADQIAFAQYSDAALRDVSAPRIAAVVEAAFTTQTRDASLIVLTPDVVAKPALPTDADLAAFYKEHLAQLTVPELRQAELVKFDPQEIAATVPADEDALKKAYAAKAPTLGTPEQRTFVEVTATDAAAANAIAAGLKSGQSPDAVAAAHGGKVIQYAAKAQGDVPDAKIAAAAFALKAGDVSAPVTGDFGMGVVKVSDVKPAQTPSYESVRAKLLADYQQGKAADKINQLVNDFQKAHDAGEAFDTTVQKMGLKVIQLPPMTAQGATGNPQQDFSRFPNVVKDIYDLNVGQSSDVQEMGGGQYYVLKLVSDKPAGPRPFDAVKTDLARAWIIEKVSGEMSAAADQAMTRLNAGEKMEKVAADLHVPVQALPNLDRNSDVARKLPQSVIGRIFGGKSGETFQAPADQVHIIIGRIDAVHQASPQAINSAASTVRAGFSRSFVQDLAVTTRKVARLQVKAKTYPDVAIHAIGATVAGQSSSSSTSSSKAKS